MGLLILELEQPPRACAVSLRAGEPKYPSCKFEEVNGLAHREAERVVPKSLFLDC